MQTPAPVDAIVDHDAGTVTVAVTFHWDRDRLALDKCEAAHFLGRMREALVAWLTEKDGFAAPDGPVVGLSYQCFEPNEEWTLGYLPDYSRPAICTLCGQNATAINQPPWFIHIDETDCRCFIIQEGDKDGNVVRFHNLLDVTFPRKEQ